VPKWLKLLIAVCAGLVVLWGVSRLPRKAKSALTVPAKPVKIEIERKEGAPASGLAPSRDLPSSQAGGTVVLEKTGDQWNIARPLPFPADRDGARFIVDGLVAFAVGERLSDRADSHGVYGVDDSSGVTVRVHGEGEKDPVSLVFGKMAPDETHLYVRPAGKNDVYLASGLRRTDLDKPADQWRDRRLLRLGEGESITRLTVTRGKSTIDFVKTSDTWKVNGWPADNNKADNVMLQLRNFYAEGFIDPPEAVDLKKWGLDKPALSFSIVTSSQTQAEFRVGAKDGALARRPAQRAGQDILYWAPEHLVTSLPTAATDYFFLVSSTATR